MKRYIRYSVPEFFLCLAMSVGLAVSVFQGFYMADVLAHNIFLLAVLCAAFLILLFLAGYSRKTAFLGVILGVLCAAGSVMLLRMLGIPMFTASSSAANVPLWVFLSVLCCLAVFLLSRSPAGSGVLFVGGALCLSTMAVLEYDTVPWAFVLFLFAAGVMVMYKRYWKSVMTSSTAENAFGPMLSYATVMMIAVTLLGCGIWWAAVRPLQPPVQDIRLVTRIVSVEVLDKMGVSHSLQVLDRNSFSTDINENEHRVSNQMGEDEETIPVNDAGWTATGSQVDDNSAYTALRQQQKNKELLQRIIQYLQAWLKEHVRYIIGALILLALCGIVLFFLRRRIWHHRMMKLPAEERSIRYYHWYRKKFRVLGFPSPGTDTPLEYAVRLQDKTIPMDGGVKWMDVTSLFMAVYYGGQMVTAEGERLLEQYYQSFYRGCRTLLGGRYILKSFRL